MILSRIKKFLMKERHKCHMVLCKHHTWYMVFLGPANIIWPPFFCESYFTSIYFRCVTDMTRLVARNHLLFFKMQYHWVLVILRSFSNMIFHFLPTLLHILTKTCIRVDNDDWKTKEWRLSVWKLVHQKKAKQTLSVLWTYENMESFMTHGTHQWTQRPIPLSSFRKPNPLPRSCLRPSAMSTLSDRSPSSYKKEQQQISAVCITILFLQKHKLLTAPSYVKASFRDSKSSNST